jgi:hypothetical protein
VTPQEFLAEAERRLAGAKFAVERVPLPGAEALVGRRKPFRVRWMLTQLKTSVVVAAVEHATAEGWLRFNHDAFTFAKQIKGGLPTGIQSGVGAVPVLAANTVEPAAAQLAAQQPPKVEWFSGFALPALVELSTGRVYQFDGRVLVGAIYMPFLKKQRALVTSIAS